MQILNEEIVFEEGEVEKTLTIDIVGDEQPEPDESVLVYLTEPTGNLSNRAYR